MYVQAGYAVDHGHEISRPTFNSTRYVYYVLRYTSMIYTVAVLKRIRTTSWRVTNDVLKDLIKAFDIPRSASWMSTSGSLQSADAAAACIRHGRWSWCLDGATTRHRSSGSLNFTEWLCEFDSASVQLRPTVVELALDFPWWCPSDSPNPIS